MGSEEIFDVVDEHGNVIGRATREQVHSDRSLIHRSVHVHVFDSRGRLFLQKRSADKDIQPGRWDTSVGGHVDAGEDADRAAVREIREELGIRGVAPRFMYSYIWRSPVETELVSTYGVLWDGPVSMLESELDDGRYWEPEEIAARIGERLFTPNFEEEFRRLKEFVGQRGQ